MRIYKIFTKKLITSLSNDNSLSFNRATLLRSARKFNSSVPLMIRVEWILNWRKYLSTSTATRVYVQTTCIRKNANRAGTFRLITRLRVKFEWLKRARRLLPVEQWFSIKPCVWYVANGNKRNSVKGIDIPSRLFACKFPRFDAGFPDKRSVKTAICISVYDTTSRGSPFFHPPIPPYSRRNSEEKTKRANRAGSNFPAVPTRINANTSRNCIPRRD